MKKIIASVAITLFFLACNDKADKTKTSIRDVKNEANKNADTSPIYPSPTKTVIDPKLLTLNKLQGKWQSLRDENNIIEFTGDKRIEYYDEEKIVEAKFTIQGDTLKTTDIPAGSILEYQVDQLTDDQLTVIYLARGNTLMYKKVK